jgi:hypothetical protein
VVAIRYCTSTASASRSPPPTSTPITTTLAPLSGTAPACPRHAYRKGQRPPPTRRATTRARPRSRSDNTSADQAHIPPISPPTTGSTCTAPARESAGHHAGRAVVGRPTSPLRLRTTPHSRKNKEGGWWARPRAAGEGNGAHALVLRAGRGRRARGPPKVRRPGPVAVPDALMTTRSVSFSVS